MVVLLQRTVKKFTVYRLQFITSNRIIVYKILLSLHIGKVKTNGKTIVSNASIGELKQGTPL